MSGAIPLPLDLANLSIPTSDGTLLNRSVLPSGVRVLSETMPTARSATIGFWVAVGSRDEQPITYGSTHFLEHLLFKGTTTLSALDIAVAFDSVGGEHNALTAKEHTCYYAKVRDRDVDMAVITLADMFTSSTLNPEEFENERRVILEELAMADDDPNSVAGELLFSTVFGDHPLGRPIGGNPETIRAVSRDAVWEHYRKNYRPADLVITAAGAIDHQHLIEVATAALANAGWDMDAIASPVARRQPSTEQIRRTQAISVTERPLEQVNLYLGTRAFAAADKRRNTLSVLNAVLGAGMSSRLFQEVREKRGLAYSVYSFAASYSDTGILGLYAGCSANRAADVVELLRTELKRMADEPVGEDELRRVRGQLSGASALALEDSDTRMNRLGRSELTLGEFTDLDETLRQIEQVDPEQIRELAAEVTDQDFSLAAVGPVNETSFTGLIDAN